MDSGASWDLPGLMAAIDGARRRDFDVLLVYDPDRLSRRLAKQLVIKEELEHAGVTVRYATIRTEATSEGRLLENIKAVIAEYEREKIALRTSRGRASKAHSGKVVGTGIAPFGYRYVRDNDATRPRIIGLEPDPATAPIARRIFEELLTTASQHVAEALNAEGIPTIRAHRWSGATLLDIARNPVYYGQAAYGRRQRLTKTTLRDQPREHWIETDVPALVTRDLWDRVQEALRDRMLGRGGARMTDDPFVLRGLITCGHCHGRIACESDSRYRYYLCTRRKRINAQRQGVPVCPLSSLPAGHFEQLVWESVSRVLRDPSTLPGTLLDQRRRGQSETDDRRTALEKDRWRAEKTLRSAMAALLDEEPDTASWSLLREHQRRAQADVARIDAQLAALDDLNTEPITAGARQSLTAFARAIGDQIRPELARDFYDALRVRLTVRNDANGWKIGRHAFAVEIDAGIPIEFGYRDGNLLKSQVPYRISIPVSAAG